MQFVLQNDIIDLVLDSHQESLGKYFDQYRNHVYRVYNFAITEVKSDREIKILSIAAAFHDLGIWTSNTFDYLKPSIDLAKKYCIENSIDISEIEIIIDDHHQLTKTKRSRLAELFRQADMTDLTFGLIGKHVDRKQIRNIRKTFPNKGFHITLCKLFARNLIKNPLSPLPMFKL